MTKNTITLELNQIHKGFKNTSGELKVLADISLTVQAGEIIALIGPSGCGKTTLLNIISGIAAPDRGTLRQSPSLRLAYVFQEPRLLPWKTVEGNIRFVQDNFLAAQEGKEVREKLLQKTGLLAYKDSYPAQLSGGMKQRLELVRALAIKPQLLLMDEPFKSLDLALKFDLQRLLLTEHEQEGFALLFTTHDPDEAVMLADRVVVLSDKPTQIHQEMVIGLTREKRTKTNPHIQENVERIIRVLLERQI
jgi:NitT/TauT family transport system ATP-binding protein